MNRIFAVVLLTTVFDSFSDCQTTSGCSLPSGSSSQVYCDAWECERCSESGQTCHLAAGSIFTGTVARVQCAQNHRLSDDRDHSVVSCNKGKWVGDFLECLPQCPPLYSETVVPHCFYNGREVDCRSPTLPSTTATANCKPTYSPIASLESKGVYGKRITCLYNGKWSATLPECEPDCGRSKGSAIVAPTVALDAVSTPLGVFPWHAGIYQKDGDGWKYICGGSLISKQVVITAAHCIRVSSFDELRVTFAKYYRAWERDEADTVKRSVSDVSIPREFSYAVTTLLWDIALLLLSEPVQFNSFVMPVCLTDRPPTGPLESSTGYVVGWGKTNAVGQNSEFLLHNNISVQWENSCDRQLATLVAFDKFCASKEATSVVEKGDSGGGLTAVFGRQHYLVGIVSVKYNDVSVFTNVTWDRHVSWRNTEMSRFDENLSRCPRRGFACASTGRCVSGSARCDGYRQCPDGSDEEGCPPPATNTGPPVEVTESSSEPKAGLPPPPVEHGRVQLSNGNIKLLLLYNNPVDWNSAEKMCVANNTHLASIRSEEENNELKAMMKRTSGKPNQSIKHVWVGGSDQMEEGKYTWVSDGSALGWTNWWSGHPDNSTGEKDCIMVILSYGSIPGWWDFPCKNPTTFVCEKFE